MLNLEMGTAQTVNGRPCILTTVGIYGHAVYGPYESLAPGDYAVEMTVSPGGAVSPKGSKPLAVIDISCDSGRQLLARREIRAADLSTEPTRFVMSFQVPAQCRAEYRIWVSGEAPLLIEDNHRAVALGRGEASADAAVGDARFPEESGADVPFFVRHRDHLRSLFERGFVVRVVDSEVRLAANGVVLHARCDDDLMLIGELFLENTYNFRIDRPVCAIDVGMNLGLATLQFAAKAEVAEVHSFEPFAATYARALANIALNPAIAGKITPYRLGLSDHDRDGTVLAATHGVSGAMMTLDVEGGTPTQLSLRDAGPLLAPIIEAACARGMEIVMKVDCEGSEFAVFESLERAGLLGKVRAFMVEWHAMFDGKTQETLTAPLRVAGFVVFDRSPPVGNGFFYAVRA